MSAPSSDNVPRLDAEALLWTRRVAHHFVHVALFHIQGTHALCLAAHGVAPGCRIALAEPTPLRWTLEAATPLIGAGRAPGGGSIARHLGLPVPRAFAVLPFLQGDRLVALLYLDHGDSPLPCDQLSALLGRGTGSALSKSAAATPPEPAKRRRKRQPSRPKPRRGRSASSTQRSAEDAGAPAQACDQNGNDPPTQALTSDQSGNDPPTQALTSVQTGNKTPTHAAACAQCGYPPLTSTAAGGQYGGPQGVAVPAAVKRTFARRWLPAPLPALSAAAGLAVALALGSLLAQLRPPEAAVGLTPAALMAGPKEVFVEPTASLSHIAQQLHRDGLLRAPRLFVWLARLQRLDTHVRTGFYAFPAGLWPWQILARLHAGQVATVRLTFPEGLSLKQSAALASNFGLYAAQDFLKASHDAALLRRYGIEADSAEGYLFPDTYQVVRGSPPSVLLDAMLERFFDRLQDLPEAAELSGQALHDRVILASLVERETFDRRELRRVAGVFVNRLDRNMRLESCATVQYLLRAPKAHLQLQDVRLESPYNTYLHPGLPPGPIASPGLAALDAALRPESHEFLFFVAREDGSHRHQFSTTFAAHQSAVRGGQRH
jgi:UPF0755 protein